MFKVLLLLKRRTGMSMADFRSYYEDHHSKLGMKHGMTVKRYIRRYVTPLSDPAKVLPGELDFDVITELWFDDQAAFEKMLQHLSKPEVAEEVVTDEENLFDRSKTRIITVNETETTIP
jgi:hypothetical protein